MKNQSNRAFAKGKIAIITERIVPRWSTREDSEHEQAVIRLLVGGFFIIYLLIILPAYSDDYTVFNSTLALISTFCAGASIVLAWLYIDPSINKKRRLFGCIIDIGCPTVGLWINGDFATPLFVIYLWVTFGNGFRFGRKYLFFSMILSFTGFISVVLFSKVWSVDPIVTLGLIIGLLVLPLYVSSLIKQMERAFELSEIANQTKSTFLATMSHEIRTPLNGLIGILDLIKKTKLDGKQRRYIELLDTSSDWLLNVITDGLDFTKIEANELIIDARTANLVEVLEEIAAIFSESSENSIVKFEHSIDKRIPTFLECDQFRIAQVLNNLINNGFKFTEDGEVQLLVQCENKKRGMVTLSFTVKDSGIGIEQNQLLKIFEPFQQAKNNYTYTGGTGLGLAIANNLVGLMGGHLIVESIVDEGTIFSFNLDLPIALKESSPLADFKNESAIWTRQPNILLVEDNEINREVAINLLSNFGCTITTAVNGLEASEKVQKKVFDLILMDCQMPVMDGYEATVVIGSFGEKYKKIPIVALTAFTTQQDRQKCFDSGMVDYVGKPYSEEGLKHLLHKWLAHLISGYQAEVEAKEDGLETKPVVQEKKVHNRAQVHDLRNSLTAVLGSAQLAKIYSEDPEVLKKQLDSMLIAAEKAVEITDDM